MHPPAAEVDGDDHGSPLPVIVTAACRHPIVNRDKELRVLRAAIGSETANLGTSIVLVSGASGIGKTRLVAEAAAEAHRDGARMWFEVAEPTTRTALAPLASWACTLALGVSARRQRELRSGPLRVLFEPPGAWPPPADADRQRWALHEAMAELVAEACARRSVLVLDDLQHAPSDTLAFLGYLLRTRPGLPLCIVGSFRPGPVDDRWLAAMRSLKRLPSRTDIVLPPLDRQASAELFAVLSSSADWAMDAEAKDALADRLVQITGGNPALIHIVASDPDFLGHAGWGTRLPGTLAREVAGRLTEQLDADTRWTVELASAAAIAQPVVTGRVLVAAGALIARPSSFPVLDGARKATHAGILHEAPGVAGAWRFDNELFCHSVYEGIPAGHRERIHGALGDVLRALPEPVNDDRRAERIAFHLYRAWPACPAAEAALWLRAAAERAIDRADYEGAATLVAQALELYAGEAPLIADRSRGELWLLLGRARAGSGDASGAAAAYKEAGGLGRQHGWPDIEAAGAVNAFEVRNVRARPDDADVVALRHVMRHSAHLDCRTLADLVGSLSAADPAHWRDIFEDTLDQARCGGDRARLPELLSRLWWFAPIEWRPRVVDELTQVADDTGDTRTSAYALLYGWVTGIERGLRRFDDDGHRLAALVRAADHPPLTAEWRRWGTALATSRGNPDDPTGHPASLSVRFGPAEQPELDRAADDARSGVPHLGLSSIDDALRSVAQGLRSQGVIRGAIELRCFRAAAAAMVGDPRVDRLCDELLDDGILSGARTAEWLGRVTLLAAGCARSTNFEAINRCLEVLRPYADVHTVVGGFKYLGVSHDRLGRLSAALGDDDAAAGHFAAAAAAHTGVAAHEHQTIGIHELGWALGGKNSHAERADSERTRDGYW